MTNVLDEASIAEYDALWLEELQRELPAGLQLLLIRYPVFQFNRSITRNWDDSDEASKWLDQLGNVFDAIGFTRHNWPGSYSPFSAAKVAEVEFMVGIVATPAFIEQIRDKQGRHDIIPHVGFGFWTSGPGELRLGTPASVVLSSFGRMSNDQSFWEYPQINGVKLKNHGMIPPLGTFASWITTVQTTEERLKRLVHLAEASGGNIDRAADMLKTVNMLESSSPTSFLVPGLIPHGAVTLLLGNRKVGKSAIALELAVSVARREPTWVGFPLARSKGIAVYLSGEDAVAETFSRVRQMTGGSTPLTLLLDGRSNLDDILQGLNNQKPQKVSLLVVDPARKYYVGDEDGSDAVSEFFTKLEDFARKTGAAVVVTHHLKRHAQPKNASDVAHHYRGSGVFLDRPRVTLALHRSANGTQLAIPVLDGTPLHNFRQSEMFSGVRRLRRDEKTFRHVPIDEPTAAASTTKEVDQGDVDRIFEAAYGVLAAAGDRLTRTGPAGLFERKLPALAGLSRAKVRAAVDALVSQGRVNADGAGVLTLPAAANDDDDGIMAA